jgi:membrane-associated phospholipid phosphatase
MLERALWERTKPMMELCAHFGFRRYWVLCCVVGMRSTFGCPSLGAQEAPQTVDGGAPRTVVEDAPPQTSATARGTERDVSWGTLPRNFLQDQKDIWLFPVRLAKGRDWLPMIAVTGVTAALIVADPHDTRYFRRTARFEGFNDAFSGSITAGEIAAVPAAFLIVGHFRHDSYAEKTALLAGEAYADSAIVDIVMKMATRRLRPSDIAPNGTFSDTFFRSHVSASGISTSFPSGHAAAAFAVATVFAHRYRQHRWVPWVAYGVASVISFSRVTTQAHFPSDVFLGAALGFTISEFAVLRRR